MKNKLILLTITLFTFLTAFPQTDAVRSRIKGKIIDEKTKKALDNFPIKVKEFNRTVYTDANGEFLFNMPPGTYTFVFDDYPYIKKELTLELLRDTVVEIAIKPSFFEHHLREVQVLASRKLSEKSAGITKISNADMAVLPAMVGERDVLKALSLNAGVTSSGEGAADIQVRGGMHGHNLFLLDKVPLYSTQHMFGMVSVYNPAIIQSAELHKAGFPAEYGGRIASVLDVRTKDPDLSRMSGEAEISLLATKAALNVPIVKNKLGITAAGRISNYSLINLISLTDLMKGTKIGLHFADLNTSLLYQPTGRDEIKLSYFRNSDGLNIKQQEGTTIDEASQSNLQQNIVLNWKRKLTDKSLNTLQLFLDEYKFNFGNSTIYQRSGDNEFYKVSSSIASAGIENKIDIKWSEQLSANGGIALKTYSFSPFHIALIDTSFLLPKPAVRQFESAVFAQANYLIKPGQTLDAGLRFSGFGNADAPFFSLEPRFSYHGVFSNDFSISASASRMTQNIHRVANPGMGIPLELFQPSDSFLQPEKSWVFSLGAAKDFTMGKRQMSVKADVWYKRMWTLVDFKDGFDAVTILTSSNFSSDNNALYLTQGNGKAYGIDISGIYTYNNLKLSADYTLMQARNRFDELNNGQWFAASTDITHSVSLTSEVKLKKNWIFTATWQLRSGRPVTLPTAIYAVSDIDLGSGLVTFLKNDANIYNENFQFVETGRNNARMRPFHKLDIALNHTYLFKKKYRAQLSLGLYNVYNRANPAYYFIGKEKTKDGQYYPVLKSISMFPILPSFSWSVKF